MERSFNAIAYYRDRCTPPLTQAALARALGIHTNTLQHWERQGAPAPADLLRLVTLFVQAGAIRDYETACEFWKLSGRSSFLVPREVGHLFTPSVDAVQRLIPEDTLRSHTPPPAHSRMPFQRNRLFVGRVEELQTLAVGLHAPDVTVVICGMAGVGKTQLACELVHRFGHNYPGGVFWISFANEDTIAASIASCGREEHLALRPDFDQLPLNQQVSLVMTAWRGIVPRLLVFDNCEDEQLIRDWRPVFGGCRVVVTSRRIHWSTSLVTHVLPLAVLARDDSMMLLRGYQLPKSTSSIEGPEVQNATALDGIADELGDLPLALHLAGMHMARFNLNPRRYLAQLRDAPRSKNGLLLQLHHPLAIVRGASPTNYGQNVAQAFALSYEQLQPDTQVDAVAMNLLARSSYFAPGEPIPQTLLVSTIAEFSEDGDTIDAAISRLVQDIGFLERGPEQSLRMHRLVATYVRMVTADANAQAAVEQSLLVEAQRLNESRAPGPMLALEHHLFAVTDAAIQRGAPLAADLAAELGWQRVLLSRFEEAQRYLEQSLTIREQVLGILHKDTATSINRLGLLYHVRGDLRCAQPFFERALAIWEQTLGAAHPETLNGYNNLGYLLCQRGDHPTAYAYLWKTLTFRRRLLGLCHSETARTINNIGYLLRCMGKLSRSRRYLKLALAIRQRILPADSPVIALTLNNLGDTLAAEGNYDDARRYYEQALTIRAAAFGSDSFQVAESLKGVGLILQREGEHTGAHGYLQQALASCEITLGVDHFETAWKYDAIGECMYAQGDYRTARPYYQHALQVYTTQFLPEHPDIQRVRERLEQIAYHLDELA